MRTLTRALPLALAAALLVLLAIACSGGGDQTTSNQPAGQTDDPSVADDGAADSSGDLVSAAPIEVLSASAESFQQEVDSVQMEMDLTMNIGGFAVDADMDMAFQAPDQMHITMDFTGLGTFEMLILGSDIYMDVPYQGWVVFSPDDLGLGEFIDTESFQDVFGDHSLLDYEAVIESLGGDVQDLGEETVDGDTYRHYRATVDFADLAAAFGDAIGATENLNLDDVSGPLVLDVWVDPDTLLPHRLVVDGEFAFGQDTMVFDATMRMFGYNEPVQIPGPPPDAVPFTLMDGP